MKNQYAIILAGGSGTRLWPLSRSMMPKQLLTLDGDASLLQQTAKRLLKRIPAKNIVTVAHANHRFEVIGQLHAIHPDLAENVLIEPIAKNTLPAISWAASWIFQKEKDACVGVFSSDQAIQDEAAFCSAWESAEKAAALGHIALFGILPTSPATGYGYIKAGESIDNDPKVKKVTQFVEKPDQKTAERYLKEGNYFWNGGMFVFLANAFLKLLEKHQPIIFSLAEKIVKDKSELADKNFYDQFPSLSIDYGLMEKISESVVVPVDMGWTDLGSWESVYQFLKKDENSNVVNGKVVALESENNLLWSDAGLIAAFGISDLSVIQTQDATLICPRDKTDELKSLIKELGKDYAHLLENHVTVSRPWGSYTVLEEGPRYKIKRIVVTPGERLSLQMHHHRCEHLVVVQGQAHVICGDKEKTLERNESVYILKGQQHRLSNYQKIPLEIIEVQIGDYVGEDDIVRLEDVYKRGN